MKVSFNGIFTKAGNLIRKTTGAGKLNLVTKPQGDVCELSLKAFSKEIGVIRKTLIKRKFSDADSFEIYDKLRIENAGIMAKLIKEKGKNGQKYLFSVEDLKEIAAVDPSKAHRLEELAGCKRVEKKIEIGGRVIEIENVFSGKQIADIANMNDEQYFIAKSLFDFKKLSGEDLISLAKQGVSSQKVQNLKEAQEALGNKLSKASIINCLTDEGINIQELLPGIKKHYEASNGFIQEIVIKKDGKFNRLEYYYPNSNVEKLLTRDGKYFVNAQI